LPALLRFGSEESKCVALEKELEQMREVLTAKDDEIAYLKRYCGAKFESFLS
jgi:hypothetical protein